MSEQRDKQFRSKFRQYIRRHQREQFKTFVKQLSDMPLWRRIAFCWLLLWAMPSDPRAERAWFSTRQMPHTTPPDHALEEDDQ